MGKKLRLHWLCDAPSPYNTDLFRALAHSDSWDLVVHYRAAGLSSHPWQSSLMSGYPSRVTRTFLGVDWQLVREVLRRPSALSNTWFVVGGWNHPTAVLVLVILALRRGNAMIWTDTPDLSRARPLHRRWLRSALLRWLFRRMRWVLGTGEPAVSALVHMGAPATKVSSFPYWIDAARYGGDGRARRVRVPGEPVTFFSTGLLDMRRKGHDVALRAFAALENRGQRNWRYSVAGAGPDAAELQNLAEYLGIADKVIWLGWLEPEQLREHLTRADVFVHPSPTHEPYGVAVLEAMATGLPVLASDRTCAALDRVRPGVEGYIHPAGEPETLSHQMEMLMQTEERERLGRAALRSSGEWPLCKAAHFLRSLMESSA